MAGDWPRTDERDLGNKVIKPLRIVSWQRSHLCAALDLKHAHGIGLRITLYTSGLILQEVSEIDVITVVLLNQINRVFQHSHDAQTEQVNLDDS